MAPPVPQSSPPPSTPPYPHPYQYPPPPTPSLSHLPPELKFQILTSLPDLPSLRSLIKASPAFHALYLHDQRRILRTLLARVIPQPVLVEVALIPALKRERCDDDEEEGGSFAERFLERYEGLEGVLKGVEGGCGRDGEVRVNGVRFAYSKGDRDTNGNSNGTENGGLSVDFSDFTLTELREIVRQHYIVHSIAEDMARSCLRVNPFTKEVAAIDDSYDNNEMLPLSETETYRIHRALYRVQILAHLYTLWRVRDPNYYTAFLKMFPPWEREEIHCVRNYMYKAFLDVSLDGNVSDCYARGQESAGTARRSRSRKRRRGSGSGNCSDSDFEFDLAIDDQREQCLTLGLEFLWKWLHHPVPPAPIANTNTSTNTNHATAIIRKKSRSTRLPLPLPIHIPLHPPSPSTPPSTPNSPTQTHSHSQHPPNTPTPPPTFLTRALNPSISLGFFRPIVNSALETFTTDAACWHRPNLGWTSLHEKNTKYSAQARNAYCRGWGYVFWDEGRLRGLGLGLGLGLGNGAGEVE
ncbi:hypothetical protein FQN50_006875 [Emmonsiellopsis sp. PD_5]|nr:hypothetical protein FQN50_006875 [Emmonsiellopsis sp. PD_5]